jgi:hypothetical protein
VQRRGSIKVNLTQEEHKAASELFTYKNPSPLASESLLLELEPHTHTLFCERKERVCMSHGKLQEHEKVTVKLGSSEGGTPQQQQQQHQQQQQYSNHCWFRSEKSPSNVASSSGPHATEGWLQGARFAPIPGTLGSMHYELAGGDVDCFVKFAPSSAQREGAEELAQSATVLGPVQPGPPRLQAFTISSSSGTLTPGQYLVANADYIGGHEGASEYWWMRIRQGERETLGEPVSLSAAQVALGVRVLLYYCSSFFSCL